MQDTLPVHQTNEKGQRICGAKARASRSGAPVCQNVALGPAGRCRMHGGFPNVAKTMTGKYGRHLPKVLRKAYAGALADPAVLSLKDDVALSTARIEGALAGLELGPTLEGLAEQWAAFQAAAASRDPIKVQAAGQAMSDAIARAGEARAKFREVERLQLHKARLAREEFRRQIAAATMIEAAAAWALVSTILELVKAHVPDPNARRAIADGLVRLTGAAALRGTD